MSTVVLMHADAQVADRLRDQIGAAPGFDVIGVAGSLAELRDVLKAGVPDLLIVDLMLPPTHLKVLMNGLRGPGRFGQPLILVLAVSVDDARLMDALRLGADGYYAHARSSTSLLATIERLVNGESAMSPQIARQVMSHFDALTWQHIGIGASALSPLKLSDMDRLLLQWTAEGYLVGEVARGLQITPQAVGVRMRNIYRKLQTDLRAEAQTLAA